MQTLKSVLNFISPIVLLFSLLFVAVFGANSLSNYLAFLSVLLLIVAKLLGDKRVFYLGFFAIYCLFGQLISLLAIESGWSLAELGGIDTHISYALVCLAITAYILINLVCWVIEKSIYKVISVNFFCNLKDNKFLYYLPVIYLALLFLPVFIYGTAFSQYAGNRIAYRENLPDFFTYLFQIRALIFPLAGLYFFNKKKRVAYTYMFMAVVWNLLVGEKASGIVITAYSILLPYVLVEYDKISNKKLFIILSLSVIFITASIIINYVFVEKTDAAFILDRISMQGQLWWYYFNEIVANGGPVHPIYREFTGEYTGMIALMEHAMPDNLFASYMRNGFILTSGFPAIFIFYFGAYWLLPAAICSIAFIVPVYFLTKSLYCGDILSFLISVRIFTSLITLVAEGSIASFIDYKLFVYIAILCLLQFVPRLKA